MRIGMLAPMPSELRPLVKRLGLRRSPSSAVGRRVHEGRVGSAEIVAAITGVGTAAATDATRRLLAAGPVDHVVVVGIAGGIDDRLAIGDVVRPRVVIDGASGAEYRPHALGGSAGAGTDGPDGPGSQDGPNGADSALRGAIHTSDDFIVDPDRVAALRERGVVALDMESAAVAAVCDERGCPWTVIRAISDRSADGLADEGVSGLARQDGSPDLVAVARYVARHPGRIPGLLRLARDAGVAANSAAAGALDASRRLALP